VIDDIRPFPTSGEWLRCQLHSHTTNSDGDVSPDALCDHYAGLGFDALAITDHWHVTAHARDGLVVIPSSELSCRSASPSGEAEALALGVETLPEARAPFADIAEMAAWIAAQGGLPVLCHPYWSGLEPAEIVAAAASLAGIEIWNGGSELVQGTGLSTVHWDAVLQAGGRLLGIATDDCHSPGRDSGLGWTWVCAAARTRESVLDALRQGACYGSTGPRLLGIEVLEDAVAVRCSEAATVRLRSGPWDGCSAHADADRMDWRGAVTERGTGGLAIAARLEYPEFWRWGRVEVVDAAGRMAWSQAFRLPGEAPGPNIESHDMG
jgi:hypothetical protein